MPNIKISTILMAVKYTIEYSYSERQWCTVFKASHSSHQLLLQVPDLLF